MPATAAGYGLADPFDADRAIDAQAHLMRDLLRAFGSVPLALAAYNAGPTRVRACGCVPPIAETQSYVADTGRPGVVGGERERDRAERAQQVAHEVGLGVDRALGVERVGEAVARRGAWHELRDA